MNNSNSCQQANTTNTRRNTTSTRRYEIGFIPPGTDQHLSELARPLRPPPQYRRERIDLEDIIVEALAIVGDMEDEMDARPEGDLQ
jgi:hypothetical protein